MVSSCVWQSCQTQPIADLLTRLLSGQCGPPGVIGADQDDAGEHERAAGEFGGDGIWPSRSHAYSSAKRTSAMPVNEASLAPVPSPAHAMTRGGSTWSQAARRQQEG
jgi:hypothetical protein